MKGSKTIGGVVAVLAAIGCGSAPVETSGHSSNVDPAPGDTSSQSAKLYSVTSVELDGDKAPTVKVSMYTAEQMALRREAKAAVAAGEIVPDTIGTDSCSDYSALDIWDSTQNASCALPGSNEICFKGQGTADLSKYCRLYVWWGCEGNWVNATRYYWPGSENGDFEDYCGIYCIATYEYFSGGQSCTTAGTVAQGSNYVTLSD